MKMPSEDNILAWGALSPYQRGEWDMFENVTSVYYGKQYYFLESHGMVYSRASHKSMPMREAIQEFYDAIGECE